MYVVTTVTLSLQYSSYQDRCRPLEPLDLQDAQTGHHGGLSLWHHSDITAKRWHHFMVHPIIILVLCSGAGGASRMMMSSVHVMDFTALVTDYCVFLLSYCRCSTEYTQYCSCRSVQIQSTLYFHLLFSSSPPRFLPCARFFLYFLHPFLPSFSPSSVLSVSSSVVVSVWCLIDRVPLMKWQRLAAEGKWSVPAEGWRQQGCVWFQSELMKRCVKRKKRDLNMKRWNLHYYHVIRLSTCNQSVHMLTLINTETFITFLHWLKSRQCFWISSELTWTHHWNSHCKTKLLLLLTNKPFKLHTHIRITFCSLWWTDCCDSMWHKTWCEGFFYLSVAAESSVGLNWFRIWQKAKSYETLDIILSTVVDFIPFHSQSLIWTSAQIQLFGTGWF